MSSHAFISYSHKDRSALDELLVFLRPLERDGRIGLWEDSRIGPGENWETEIQERLTGSSVGILLVSPHFLASDYISTRELPYLLQRAQSGQLKLLWIPVRESMFEESPLKTIQALTDPKRPLLSQNRSARDRLLKIASAKILKALDENSLSAPPSSTKYSVEVHFADFLTPDKASLTELLLCGQNSNDVSICWPAPIVEMLAAADAIVKQSAVPSSRPRDLRAWDPDAQAQILRALRQQLTRSRDLVAEIPRRLPSLVSRLRRWITCDDAIYTHLCVATHAVWYHFSENLFLHMPETARHVLPQVMLEWLSDLPRTESRDLADRAALASLLSITSPVYRARLYKAGGVFVGSSVYGTRQDLLYASSQAWLDSNWYRTLFPAQVELHLMREKSVSTVEYDGTLELDGVFDENNHQVSDA